MEPTKKKTSNDLIMPIINELTQRNEKTKAASKKYMAPVTHRDYYYTCACFTLPCSIFKNGIVSLATGCCNTVESKMFLAVLATLLWVAQNENLQVKMEYLIQGWHSDDTEVDEVETGVRQCIGIRFWFGCTTKEIASKVADAIKSSTISHDQMPLIDNTNLFNHILSYLTEASPSAVLPAPGMIKQALFDIANTKCYEGINDKQKVHNKSYYVEHLTEASPSAVLPAPGMLKQALFGIANTKCYEGINDKQKVHNKSYYVERAGKKRVLLPARFPYPKMTYLIPSSMLHPDIFFNTVLPRFKGSTLYGSDSDQWKTTSLELILKRQPEMQVEDPNCDYCKYTAKKAKR
eukprot:CAMPEP_0203746586 /NCGR_PEP_ID=MMETSP0098-20131031/1987_1 /ASSEMBLY_ACC=CAM_ASM_000208 /TAXON_ID=96639 /ORGANISM=" , Strain NY0313808BC1" /LENGTH=348 /DNA_ID=CAMNT_0050634741 /DNA_START=68 /DNA_END=1117 /DNA_ORIENTATION=+